MLFQSVQDFSPSDLIFALVSSGYFVTVSRFYASVHEEERFQCPLTPAHRASQGSPSGASLICCSASNANAGFSTNTTALNPAITKQKKTQSCGDFFWGGGGNTIQLDFARLTHFQRQLSPLGFKDLFISAGQHD